MSEFDDDPTIPFQAHEAAHDPKIVFPLQKFEWFLLRYAEVGLMAEKGRLRMEKALRTHLMYHAKQIGLNLKRVENEFGRIVVQLDNSSLETTEKILEITQKVFGIVSISPALKVDKNLTEIGKVCANYANKFLIKGQKVAVKVKGEQSQFDRKDIAKICHEHIIQQAQKDITVNLHDPDLRLFVEIRKTGAFIYSLVIPTTFGGLPTDKETGVIAPFSGNPTEIVSAIKMMRRGVNLFPVIFRTAINDKRKAYWNRVDALLNLHPFPRVYGIEFNLDNIHRRLEKKLTRYWNDLDAEWKKQIEGTSIPNKITIEAMHQGIFCLFCWKLRFALNDRILAGQKGFYATCLGSEGELIIKSNLFLDDRWDEHPAGPKKAIFTPDLPKSDKMNKMELYRVRFKAQLSGVHKNTICPFDPILFSFTMGYEHPAFHPTFILDSENIVFEFNAVAPKCTPSPKDEVLGSINTKICNHPPILISNQGDDAEDHTILAPFLSIFQKCLEKMNFENLVSNIYPEGQILALKDEE